MKFDMVTPCPSCPFRVDGDKPIRLTEDRVIELTANMLDSSGGTFACHETVDYSDDDDGDDTGSNVQHCAGALIFAEKNGTATQLMRIAERLHCYDAKKLAPHYDLVFDDEDSMIDAQ